MRPAAACLLAALLPGCSSDPVNPFADQTLTLVPRADAEIVFTSNHYAARAGSPREIFAASASGAALTRLTVCGTESTGCDIVEVAPAADRQRVMLRRIAGDADGDGRVTADDPPAIVFLDLSRGVESQIVPSNAGTTAVDWSPAGEVIVYAARGEGNVEDLFRMDTNGANNRNLTSTAGIRERRARIDPTGTVAVFERIGADGKAQVFIFNSSAAGGQVRVTAGGPGSDLLPGTPYRVGSDADPDYSPDGRSVVFRRLVGLGAGSRGLWDVMTVRTDGTGLATVAGGAAYRGAPDWSSRGIVFHEVDGASGVSRVVVVQPGSAPQTILTLAAGFELGPPRWLRP